VSSLIELEDLTVSIKQINHTVNAVEGVSFHINPQEVFALVGESGCGKTLTALSILRLLPPNIELSGKVFYKKDTKRIEILSLEEEKLRFLRGKEISMVFQEPMTSLNPVITIKDQLIEPLLVHENISKKEAIDKAIELLQKTGFREPEMVLRSYPHQLSGGMRQRVMLCMAIICNPKLLIADEPTTALDVTIQAEIMELLKEIQQQRGLSVLLITHNLALVYEIAHTVAIMYAGSIVEKTTKEKLFTTPLHPYTRGLLESIPTERGKPLKPIHGTVPPPGHWPKGCKFAPRCRYKKQLCEDTEPVLEPVSPEHLVRCHFWRQIQ